jgi:hypothetical protein
LHLGRRNGYFLGIEPEFLGAYKPLPSAARLNELLSYDPAAPGLMPDQRATRNIEDYARFGLGE